MSAPGHDRANAPAELGRIIAGRFRIDGVLGTGGMASVFRATDLTEHRAVALKLLRADLKGLSEAVARFRREAEILARLAHPGIVRVHASGELEDSGVYLAMELLEGETLGNRMRRSHLSPRELAPIVSQTAAALMAAHAAGVVHRDLKPDNIFLARDAGSPAPTVRLLDFGISKVLGLDRITQTGQILGTPRYMGPEQLAGERDIDGRVDVYALGVILYEALAGQPPFIASNASELIVAILHGKAVPLRSVRTEITPELEAVVSRAMAKSRADRFENPMALAEVFWATLPPEPLKRDSAAIVQPTSVLGSFDRAVATPPSNAGRALARGTFSELAVAATATPTPASTRTRLEGFGVSEAAPFDAPSPVSAVRARPPVQVGGLDARVDAWTLADDAEATGTAPASRAPHTPALVLVAAIVLGALVAVAALLGFRLWNQHATRTTAAVPPTTQAARDEVTPAAPVPTAPASAPRQTVAPVAAARATTVEAPEAPATDAGTTTAPPLVPRPTVAQPPPSRHPRRPSPNAPLPAPAVTPPPVSATVSPLDLLRDARREHAAGRNEACLELVERALGAGAPSTAFRIRGDCLRALGRSSEAVAAYERFCRLAPDHPAIGEVRALAESLGGTCP